MKVTWKTVWDLILLLAAVGVAGWFFARALKRSDDPARLIFKWILTGLVLAILIWVVRPIVAAGGYGGAFLGVPLMAVCGLVLAIIWRHNIASMIARPFVSLYDGGDQEAEPRPAYSIAQAKRNRGKYTEAVAEIRAQLARFPGDVEGQMLLAEIQAENLNDLPGAEITIQRLCDQPGHATRNVAYALNSLADWHLRFARDRDAAKQDLEKVIALLPNTEMAALAAQRIAHLPDTAHLLAPHDRQPIRVTPGLPDLGLRAGGPPALAPEIDPATQVTDYVKHLEQHPLDTEAREKLAVLYADHYGRLDLATDQLEQLIAQPDQPAKRTVHWLNLLADLQIRRSAGYETVRQTVQRIIDLFPDSAAAQTARNRLDHLKLELKAKEESPTVKLGTYEQDIGLKRGLPHQF